VAVVEASFLLRPVFGVLAFFFKYQSLPGNIKVHFAVVLNISNLSNKTVTSKSITTIQFILLQDRNFTSISNSVDI
jgi:hypothetical protein